MSNNGKELRWTLPYRCPKCGNTYSGGDECIYCEVELVENPRTDDTDSGQGGSGR